MADDTKREVLFEARMPIYPRSVKGRFRRIKWAILALAYGVYFLLPWLRWERPGGIDQAVLFDIQARKFYLFNLTVYPQDIFWLAGILVIAAILLFFVTGVAGRVFCGYFCFQTLWTDVFILIERIVQGERPARIRLDKMPWGPYKFVRKGLTHLLWLLVAFATGLTFVLYWGDAPTLLRQFFTGEAPFPAYATAIFLTATTYVMAGLAREQVCTYMCPYARFQSIMFDTDTKIVAYEQARGEGKNGRAKLGKGRKQLDERHAQGLGDCIDCGFCVQVCPMGIDIRNGLQMQCTSCALCIDACDNIMDSLGWPRGLIRYTSEAEQKGGKARFWKPKTIGYGLVLLASIVLLVWSVASRSELSVAARQVRQPLYVVLSNGDIQNSYDIKLNNKSDRPMKIRITQQGLDGAVLDMGRIRHITLSPGQRLQVHVKVRMRRSAHGGQIPFDFIIQPVGRKDLKARHVREYFSMPGGDR